VTAQVPATSVGNPANASTYRPELDSLRAIAIVIVLLHHYIDGQFVLGGFGVMLFFVLSSYFGTRSLLQLRSHVEAGAITAADALKTFYGRRYLRIMPVHVLVLTVTVVANVEYARAAFWWNAPFLANFGMLRSDEWFGRFSPLWSLAALEQFYLWWPFVMLRVPRRRLWLIVGAAIATASVWRIVCLEYRLGSFAWTVAPMATIDQLGFGALLALMRAEPSRETVLRLVRPLVAWPCGLVLLALVGARLGGIGAAPYEVFWISAVGCLFFMWLIDRSLRGIGGTAGALLRNPIAVAAGRMSYSVFLLHSFSDLLVPHVGALGALLDTNARSLVLIPLTFVLAHASWTYVEVPIARLRKRFRVLALPSSASVSFDPRSHRPTELRA